jgi:hypothetical protein
VTTSQTTGQNPSSTRQGPTPETYHGAGSPDEISLVDLAKVLWNRRWWMVSIAVATVVLALLFALTKEHEYRYTTTLRIGEVNIDKRVSNVEEVRETLERQLLPSLRRSFTDRHGLQRLPFDLAIEAGQAGGLVALVSESVVENEGLVRAFHSELASMLVARHSEMLDVISSQTERRLKHLYTRLEFHEQRLEELNLLASAVAALDLEESAALGAGRDPRPERRAQGGELSGRVVSSGQDPTLTSLMSRLQVSDLMNQYETSRSGLMREIENSELQRNWITPTHVVAKALRSESPVGTGRSLILALGLVLGAMLGLFGAFLAEFGAQVRESLKAPADA